MCGNVVYNPQIKPIYTDYTQLPAMLLHFNSADLSDR